MTGDMFAGGPQDAFLENLFIPLESARRDEQDGIFGFPVAPRQSIMSSCEIPKQKVELKDLKLPREYRDLGVPWVRYKHAKVYESEKLAAAWKTVEQFRVRGLNDTFHELSNFLEEKGCFWFIWGGAVRDLVLGKKPSDIDAAVTCNPHRLKRICSGHYGSEKCLRPNPESGRLTIGGEEDKSPNTIDPVDLCHWNATYQVYASHWEFSLNTLGLWVDKRDPRENKERVYLIDVTGFGLEDACNRIFRIPAKKDYWNEWSNEEGRSVVKLLRFWKLRLRGFSPLNEDEIDFVVQEAKARFDDERFAYFFCHKILEGFSHEDGCQIYKFKPEKVEKFIDLISQDFGREFYSGRLKPIILETLKKSNVEWNLIENMSI